MEQFEVGAVLREQMTALQPLLEDITRAFIVRGIDMRDGGIALLFVAATALMKSHTNAQLTKEDLDSLTKVFRDMLVFSWGMEATK